MKEVYRIALEKHKEWQGKLRVELNAPLDSKEDLSIAYTPGVAQPCLEIAEDPNEAYTYTWKGNVVAVVSDGTAVLGLGDIGALGSMPVMEGKCALFKRFAGVNAVPILLDTKDPKEIIETVQRIAPSFGGINLEDIAAPKCVEIERELIDRLDIPVFHDDQHGTAIVVTAGLINAVKLTGKNPGELTAVVSGVGAAGSSIIKMIRQYGIGKVFAFNSRGIVHQDMENPNPVLKEVMEQTNPDNEKLSLEEAMKQADIFIGVSAAGVLNKEMVASMKKDAILFAMANPEPEIDYHVAKEAGARVVGTGRSDFPNQVNNVLAFPGLFKGALAVRASKITEEMKMAAAEGIAGLISDDELQEEYVIPSAFDERVADAVAEAVKAKAIEQGLHKK